MGFYEQNFPYHPNTNSVVQGPLDMINFHDQKKCLHDQSSPSNNTTSSSSPHHMNCCHTPAPPIEPTTTPTDNGTLNLNSCQPTINSCMLLSDQINMPTCDPFAPDPHLMN